MNWGYGLDEPNIKIVIYRQNRFCLIYCIDLNRPVQRELKRHLLILGLRWYLGEMYHPVLTLNIITVFH